MENDGLQADTLNAGQLQTLFERAIETGQPVAAPGYRFINVDDVFETHGCQVTGDLRGLIILPPAEAGQEAKDAPRQ